VGRKKINGGREGESMKRRMKNERYKVNKGEIRDEG
jgi:hypothetical protein